MKTEVAADGAGFRINGRPTYEGVSHRGRSIEGLLFNSRMIQAVFDDECPQTRRRWRYPDTGVWDADRNTDEFCACLPQYRAHGLLAVTVGLQGGGAIFTADIYDRYECSAFGPDGSFREPYFDRLLRVLAAADEAGMVVIVNYFYWKHAVGKHEGRFAGEDTVRDVTARTTDRLLRTGHRNILVDVANESGPHWQPPIFQPDRIHELIEVVQQTKLDGRSLPVGCSSGGGKWLPGGKWLAAEDFSMPHGNGLDPDALKAKLRRLKETEECRKRPRPIVVNEDSVFVENLEAAVEEGCSWGFYCQGYGSVYRDRMDWKTRGREDTFEALSGYQTPPVNWGINTPIKRAFFDRLKEITGGT